MTLIESLMKDMKAAMKAQDKETLTTIRSLKAAVMYYKIKQGHELTPEDELTVLASAIKMRKESLEEFKKGGREDLVEQTEHELAIIAKYMPKQLSETELEQVIIETISDVGASGKQDFGKVMKVLMPKIKGKADGKLASEILKKKLS
ncbi:GatB/YqeY domain-containing protein [Lactobacillus iners]|uniref:GatB/YqeY domain-containing protein n=1 Tax=Lactobacillus iners TaxID=147802 RepID=UPI001F098919|nr:GatB/YqeY domain-containing protein [Lactobacillus iners]MCT7835642.1 GatB/YqeY domain-containing protein [Lactobacillus iners]MCT7837563.1 GatB/YqeY domain-containing protein [Lactobacillus iners]MCT7839439.1 GatB/YqeY domain-containing protein [Lactobacillus iners]MCT7846273.1 GatB/YqeY domain-containing protein [Lactobacillus iners]